MSSPPESETDESQEYASIPTSPQLDYASEPDHSQEPVSESKSESELQSDSSEGSPEPETRNKEKDSANKDTFHVLITGFGPYGQYPVNPSWLAASPLHNVVLQTDPGNHPRVPLADDKPPPPLDEKLLIPRSIHISTLEIPATYCAILDVVPGLHLRPPVLPGNTRGGFLKPPESGYDFMLHIGLAGRGPLRLERVGHKLGYNMRDAMGQYAPVVIAQPKDFSRRGPEGQAMAIAEKMERDRLVSAPEIQNNPPGDSIAKPNRGFGGSVYENFSDELNTDLDVTRIVQDLRQTGAEPLQTIYSSMDGGHFIGDFLYYCSLAESKRSAGPYGERRNTQVLFLHCAPVGFPLKSEEVTDAIKRTILWVCNETQISGKDDASGLPPVRANTKTMPNRFQPTPPASTAVNNHPETVEPPSTATQPSGVDILPADPQHSVGELVPPPPVQPRPSPTGSQSPPADLPPPAPPVQPPPVQPPPVPPPAVGSSPIAPPPLQPPPASPQPSIPSPASSTNESEYHSPAQDV